MKKYHIRKFPKRKRFIDRVKNLFKNSDIKLINYTINRNTIIKNDDINYKICMKCYKNKEKFIVEKSCFDYKNSFEIYEEKIYFNSKLESDIKVLKDKKNKVLKMQKLLENKYKFYKNNTASEVITKPTNILNSAKKYIEWQELKDKDEITMPTFVKVRKL